MTDTDTTHIVLGVDPGLNTTGYGVVRVEARGIRLLEAGVVRSRRGDSLAGRLGELYQGLTDVLQSFHPCVMALEDLYSHYERPKTAILMGHARGVICLAAQLAGVPVRSYGATHIKKMLTGSGHAPKAQIQLAICREFGLPQAPEPPDVADALAIALCHVFLHRTTLKGLTT